MKPKYQRTMFKKQNLQKDDKRSGRVLPLLTIVLLVGMALAACSLRPPQTPTVVGNPPTLPPATDTPQPPPESTATDEQPAPTDSPEPTATLPERVENFPDPANFLWQEFTRGLNSPVFLTHAGDGSGRVFVVEKPGRILVYENGTRLDTPFLDIISLVNSAESERGLLGLAFHPNYAENGLFFVNYTDRSGNTVVARYQVSDDPNQANPDSAVILLGINQPYANHNGGMLAFGPDGYLYIGMGDGGFRGDPDGNAQNGNTLLGKMLRIDVDSPSADAPYGIPAGNAPNALPEIWALGLRNPWRFSFDRVTGDLLIGDVGQGQWEEVNILPSGIAGGLNFGWDYYEGTHTYEGTAPDSGSLIYPVIEYSHNGGNCSVTGGYTYRGSQLPDLWGVYLFSDYCSGLVWGALPGPDGAWQTTQLFGLGARVSSFGEDEAGELYLLDIQAGVIYKLVHK